MQLENNLANKRLYYFFSVYLHEHLTL